MTVTGTTLSSSSNTWVIPILRPRMVLTIHVPYLRWSWVDASAPCARPQRTTTYKNRAGEGVGCELRLPSRCRRTGEPSQARSRDTPETVCLASAQHAPKSAAFEVYGSKTHSIHSPNNRERMPSPNKEAASDTTLSPGIPKGMARGSSQPGIKSNERWPTCRLASRINSSEQTAGGPPSCLQRNQSAAALYAARTFPCKYENGPPLGK